MKNLFILLQSALIRITLSTSDSKIRTMTMNNIINLTTPSNMKPVVSLFIFKLSICSLVLLYFLSDEYEFLTLHQVESKKLVFHCRSAELIRTNLF